jgi:DNA-binding GntR family transcriptional regulator
MTPKSDAVAPDRHAGETLTERAYVALEELIVRLELAPGSVVSETMLSERLAIGRTPIREALQRLARERLVQILPRRGVIVSTIDVRSQLRLLELRREVERLVARCAARRATPAERERFTALADDFEMAARTSDDIHFMRVDREFNGLTLTSARNEFAADAMATMQSLARRFWYHHYRQVADMPEAARLHAAVARAIAAGDEPAAAGALDALLDNIESFTRATVSADT